MANPVASASRRIAVGIRSVVFVGASLFLAAASVATIARAADEPRERINFNTGWRFQKGDPADVGDTLTYEHVKPWLLPIGSDLVLYSAQKPARPQGIPEPTASYAQPGYDDHAWRALNLPHDWGIEGPFAQELPGDTGKLPWEGTGWYRKQFSVGPEDAGRRVYLDFDGAMAYPLVWLNGHLVGGWTYGYSSFRLDLTPYLNAGGNNNLAVRLYNPPESSRWYPGSGIYRNVWLVKAAPIHVAHWGVFVTTPRVSPEAATVDVQITAENTTDADATVQVATRVYPLGQDGAPSGNPVAQAAPVPLKIAKGRQSTTSLTAQVAQPKLWKLSDPQRYVAVTTVERDGKTIDVERTPFGIRTIQFDAERGFFLNGERVPLNGVCNHHDLGALGSAINVHALQRQLEILRQMGCNAIRTSHNPPAPELLELCDRMGFVVMDEAFDCWASGKRKNDYHVVFHDWHEKDLRALIRRDRNHPCVILWSIGNEIREQGESEGWKLATHLAGIVREEDRTRPITGAFNQIVSGYNGFHKAVDVVGFNYKPNEYAVFHGRSPEIPVLGSETSSCVSTRSEYFFPVSNDKMEGRANFQVSSYDLYAPRWAMPPDDEFAGLDRSPYAAGEFVWTGFDYLGEPTPYNSDVTNLLNFSDPAEKARAEKELKELGKIRVPSRSSYFGIIDLAGYKKDRFYIYQARWRPDFPMAHILPHWSWPERVGAVTPVHVYTSGDEAELFVNGKSQGRKKREALQYRLRWDDVVYEPGELRVVAYKNGAKWAEEIVKTTTEPAKVLLSADRTHLAADGTDVAFVNVMIVDKQGLLAPRADNQIHFDLVGPGEIVGIDNGDPTSLESFQSKQRKAFHGRVLVMVRTRANETGEITLAVEADGLPKATIKLRAAAGADDRPVEDASTVPFEQVRDRSLPTLFLVGDSTVKVGSEGQRGWGEEITPYFNTKKINVVNRAIGGRSSRTFINEGRWDKVLADLKPGDFVLIQFGHNDAGALNDNSRARGTIKGVGEESEEIDNLLTHQHETVHSYGWYLRKYIADTKAKGATPIICSPVPRKAWTDAGKIARSTDSYRGWAKQVADSASVPFLDLNDIIAQKYESIGKEAVEPLFADAQTHTTYEGAQVSAACVVSGLKALPSDPLEPYFSAEGKQIPPAKPNPVK